MQIKGIDVSSWQVNIDWSKVKSAGYDFVFIKGGYGQYDSQKDPEFEAHFKGAKKAGLKVGVYWYSYADTVQRARREAKACLSVLAGRDIDLPVYFDYEYESEVMAVSNDVRTACAKAFCDTIAAAGYTPGIYASLNFLETKLDMSKLPYHVWCAQYAKECQYPGWTIWQHSDTATVPGVDGNCDVNIMQVAEPVKLCDTKAPILKNGMRGISVMVLQSALNCYGASLCEDGVLGKLTDGAVRDYQQAHGLKVDGVVGRLTWASLLGGNND